MPACGAGACCGVVLVGVGAGARLPRICPRAREVAGQAARLVDAALGQFLGNAGGVGTLIIPDAPLRPRDTVCFLPACSASENAGSQTPGFTKPRNTGASLHKAKVETHERRDTSPRHARPPVGRPA